MITSGQSSRMTYCNHEEILPAREEGLQNYHTGSFVFNNPLEVAEWNQAVPLEEDWLPPSPPDSNFGCFPSDYQDMDCHEPNSTSPPGQWLAGNVPDTRTTAEISQGQWPNHNGHVVTETTQPLDTASWLSAPHGSVDLGLSPVLSHESQNSHTLNSFSEPDSCLLPPSLDLSFVAEPSWDPSGHTVYDYPFATPGNNSKRTVMQSQRQDEYLSDRSSAPADVYPVVHAPFFFPQGGQASRQKRTVSHPHTPIRPLLPRVDSSSASSVPPQDSLRTLRPTNQAFVGPQDSASNVSSLSGRSHETSRNGVIPAQSLGHTGLPSPVQILTRNTSAQGRGVATDQPAASSNVRPNVTMPYIPDASAEDMSVFFRFDPEDPDGFNGPTSYGPTHGNLSSGSTGELEKPNSVVTLANQDCDVNAPTPDMATSATGDIDEGRYRTHHLYNRTPERNGLYYCPWKYPNGSCTHKATKLKCNYDKYIDSHLKPFRCKVENCSKLEFSSTACLLRHEREAHGMHGHGDRPHLCLYPGCDRGIPGNGFPRRYNLYDHMKRVHDHKEEPRRASGSTSVSEKRAVRSKRKASESPVGEPSPQRQKPMSLPPQQSPTMPESRDIYSQAVVYFHQPDYEAPQQRGDQQIPPVPYPEWIRQG